MGLVRIALAVAALAAITACSGPVKAVPTSYYLALGDSLSQGVQPDMAGANVETRQGYPDQLYAALRSGHPGLQLVKFGCPGETTSTMINGGICRYPGGPQLDPHPGALDEPGHLGLAVLGEHHQTLLATAHPETSRLQARGGRRVVRGDQLDGVRADLAFQLIRGASGRCYPRSSAGTMTTGQRAWWLTWVLTDPISSRANPPALRDPTTIMSASRAAARSRHAGPPSSSRGDCMMSWTAQNRAASAVTAIRLVQKTAAGRRLRPPDLFGQRYWAV